MHPAPPTNTRIRTVHIQVQRNLLPQVLEHVRAAGKMQTSKVLTLEARANEFGRGTRYKLDDAGRQTCLDEDLVDEVIGVGRRWRRLPDDHVS